MRDKYVEIKTKQLLKFMSTFESSVDDDAAVAKFIHTLIIASSFAAVIALLSALKVELNVSFHQTNPFLV